MTRLRAIRQDIDRAAEGEWEKFGEGIEFLIAGTASPAYQEALRQLMRPHVRDVRRGSIEPAVVEEVTIRAAAQTLLLDWRNIEDDDGNDLSYSSDKAYEIMSDPAYREVYEFVMECARDIGRFREEDLEEAQGN